MNDLPEDILNCISHLLDTNCILSVGVLSKYYYNYYNVNKENLLKVSLDKDTGLIVNDFTMKQLFILYKNYKFGNKRISYDKGVTIADKNNKILIGDTYKSIMYSDRVEIYNTLTNIMLISIKGSFIDISARYGHCISLSSDDKLYIAGYNPIVIENIKQIEAGIVSDYLLTKDKKVLNFDYKNFIENKEFENVVKISVIGSSLIALLSDGSVVYKFGGNTNKLFDNVIDICSSTTDSILYLHRNGDVYISGDIWRDFYIKYLFPQEDGNKLSFIFVEIPLKINILSNIISIYIDNERIITIDKDNKINILDFKNK